MILKSREMDLINNRYSIQGVDLLSLTDDFGAPLYVYDAEKIHQQFQTLNQAFDGVKLKIKYACKSLKNISILKLLKQYGSELDCVSIQEVYLGLRAGYSPEEILYTPNCVSFEEIKQAVEMGLTINIDNISIFKNLLCIRNTMTNNFVNASAN